MTLDGLRKLVVDGTEGKQWLHHPALRTRRAALRYKLREHAEVLAYQAHIRAHRLLISKMPQPTEGEAHAVSYPTASM